MGFFAEAKQKCSTCLKVFKTKSAKNRHERKKICVKNLQKTAEAQHKCATCAKGFTTISAKIRHEKTVHTVERKYRCPYCDAVLIAAKANRCKNIIEMFAYNYVRQCEDTKSYVFLEWAEFRKIMNYEEVKHLVEKIEREVAGTICGYGGYGTVKFMEDRGTKQAVNIQERIHEWAKETVETEKRKFKRLK